MARPVKYHQGTGSPHLGLELTSMHWEKKQQSRAAARPHPEVEEDPRYPGLGWKHLRILRRKRPGRAKTGPCSGWWARALDLEKMEGWMDPLTVPSTDVAHLLDHDLLPFLLPENITQTVISLSTLILTRPDAPGLPQRSKVSTKSTSKVSFLFLF